MKKKEKGRKEKGGEGFRKEKRKVVANRLKELACGQIKFRFVLRPWELKGGR